MITVDGDTSTNDTVLVMANGLARDADDQFRRIRRAYRALAPGWRR